MFAVLIIIPMWLSTLFNVEEQLYMGADLPTVLVQECPIPTTKDSLEEFAILTIQSFESIRPEAYWDVSQWTNGWGTRAKYRKETIPLEVANQRFLDEFYETLEEVEEEFPLLSVEETYATVIFAYNLGIHKILRGRRTSALLKDGEKPPFHLWCNITVTDKDTGEKIKQPLDGLVKRRAFESQMWDNWRDLYEEHFDEFRELKQFRINKYYPYYA